MVHQQAGCTLGVYGQQLNCLRCIKVPGNQSCSSEAGMGRLPADSRMPDLGFCSERVLALVERLEEPSCCQYHQPGPHDASCKLV